MTVSLRKGQGVSLRKNEFDLSSVTIGLGWDINEEKKGFLGGIFGKKEEEYDLDVIAFLCNAAGKVTDLGNVENGKPTLVNGDIVFFNSLRHKSGQIWLTAAVEARSEYFSCICEISESTTGAPFCFA